jgi:guanine deaminase
LGSDADLVVFDPATTPMLSRRTARAQSLPELLFASAVLGDDRVIEAIYVAGNASTTVRCPAGDLSAPQVRTRAAPARRGTR